MKKLHLLLLSLLSGLLFTIGWPENGFPGFLFAAFIPILLIEDYISKHKFDFHRYSVLFYTYPGFLLWNILTTYWVFNSTPVAILAWVFNALFMAVIIQLYHTSKRIIYNKTYGYLILPVYWLSFEYFHHNWDLTWPWLTLGGGFASYIKWIQWYEFTGTFGGTLWILLVNILFYKTIKHIVQKRKSNSILNGVLGILMLIVPMIISMSIFYQYEEKEDPIDVVVVQPNLDPYSEQYGLDPSIVMQRIIDLAEPMIDDETEFVICPESANQEQMWENAFDQYVTTSQLNNFVAKYPHISLIMGASTYARVFGEDTLNNAARHIERQNIWYYAYNTAMLFDSTGNIQTYHKSKLTPGVEKMPSWRILRPLERFAIDLGGTIGTLATDNKRTPFTIHNEYKVGTIICYESVYGEFTARFVRNGAKAIFVITNDGWWGHTPGHRQHLRFSSIRAIETRRSIARSANTGISALINQKGEISHATAYWEPDVIKGTINLNDELTFYVRNGNYITRISSFVAILLMLITISLGIINKRKGNLQA